ncbi:MAG: DUF4126 domain-containing protein [Myxococcota bacterium]
MGPTETIVLVMGIGWASGINLYAAVCMLGLLGSTGNLALPPDLMVLQDPIVIGIAGCMYVVEFFADKIPGVDTSWDLIHTFIRIPAGAVLAAGAVGDLSPAAELAAGLAGGTLAAGAHAVKSGSRMLINTSPEPFSNWTASIAEDVAVIAGLWAAIYNPWLFVIALLVFIALAIWLLPRIWRGLQRIVAFARRKLFGRVEPAPAVGARPATGDIDEAPTAEKTP